MRSKKNKKKLIIAIFFGLIATFSLFGSMNSQKAVINELNKKIQQQNKSLSQIKNNPNAVPQKKEEEKIRAVVAAKDIKVGDMFVLEALELKKFDEKELPPNYFSNEALVVGKKAGKNIARGGFITSAEIQTMEINMIDIPNDTRAITIPVEKFRGLASHLKVGSRIDLLKVSNPPEFIAQNIKIISFEGNNNQITRREPGKTDIKYLTAKTASAITFLIPVDLVSNVIDAMFEGQLQVITRNNNDDKIIAEESELPPPPEAGEMTSMPDVAAMPPRESKDLPEPQMPEPEPKKIEIIKASNVTTLELESDQAQISNQEDESLSDEKLKELLDMVN